MLNTTTKKTMNAIETGINIMFKIKLMEVDKALREDDKEIWLPITNSQRLVDQTDGNLLSLVDKYPELSLEGKHWKRTDPYTTLGLTTTSYLGAYWVLLGPLGGAESALYKTPKEFHEATKNGGILGIDHQQPSGRMSRAPKLGLKYRAARTPLKVRKEFFFGITSALHLRSGKKRSSSTHQSSWTPLSSSDSDSDPPQSVSRQTLRSTADQAKKTAETLEARIIAAEVLILPSHTAITRKQPHLADKIRALLLAIEFGWKPNLQGSNRLANAAVRQASFDNGWNAMMTRDAPTAIREWHKDYKSNTLFPPPPVGGNDNNDVDIDYDESEASPKASSRATRRGTYSTPMRLPHATLPRR